MSDPTDPKNIAKDLHEIKCPKCQHLLDHYLKETLRIGFKMEPDAHGKQSVLKMHMIHDLICPLCKNPLNDFLMASLDATVLNEYVVKPGSAKDQKTTPTSKNFIEWEPGFDLGINIIDLQHHKLVAIINRLHVAVSTGHHEAKFIPNIIDEMLKYTVEHFQTEEKLQIGTHYPGLAQHKSQHKSFINAVAKLQADFKVSFVALGPILDFVKGWFIEHTQSSDRLFTNFLQEAKKKSPTSGA